MNELIGNIIIGIGVSFVFVGMYGFFKFKDFRSKLLVSTTIDAMALLTVLIGAMVRSGITWFTFKVVLIVAIALVLNPVTTSKIALSEKTNEDRKKVEAMSSLLKKK